MGPHGGMIGFDFTAAFALAQASGVDAAAVAEFLPVIERAIVARMNKDGR